MKFNLALIAAFMAVWPATAALADRGARYSHHGGSHSSFGISFGFGSYGHHGFSQVGFSYGRGFGYGGPCYYPAYPRYVSGGYYYAPRYYAPRYYAPRYAYPSYYCAPTYYSPAYCPPTYYSSPPVYYAPRAGYSVQASYYYRR